MNWLLRLLAPWSGSTFPPGSQNRDGFERNADNPLNTGLFGVGYQPGDFVLRLSAVWACVRLISETISTLPLNVYERLPDGGRRLATEHPLFRLLRYEPNADMSAQTFWQAYAASMLLGGEGYGVKRLIGSRVVSIDFVPRTRMTWTRLADGTLDFWETQLDGIRVHVDEAHIFRTLAFTTDGWMALSPVGYGASVFASALSADLAANSTFQRGLLPTVGFSMEQVLKKEQRGEFRENFTKTVAGAMNAGKPFLLEGGMKAQQIGINPADAQLLESRAWSIEEICRWFAVPPHMVGHIVKTTTWGTGIEQQMLGFLTFSLRPWLNRIQQSVQRQLFSPAEKSRFFAEFDVNELLRADSAGRAAFLSQMTQNGLMTRDEGRAYENLEPMGGNAAVLTVQSNLLPIDKLGTTQPTGVPNVPQG